MPIVPAETRESSTDSILFNLLKTLLQIVLIWGFFLGLIPSAIVFLERAYNLPSFASPTWFLAGALLFAGMSGIGLTCATIFVLRGKGTPLPLDTATRLVVLGPYRYVRNPMALSGLGQGFAVGMMMGSPLTLLYAFLGVLVWNFLARPWEESDLLRRFGEPYARYREAVPCWIPRLTPYPKLDQAHPPELGR